MPQRRNVGWENELWKSELFYDINNLNCHKQSTKILSMGKLNGGSLFIGGRTSQGMTIVDLTGSTAPAGHKGTYYSVTMEEYGVPQWSTFFWESLAMTIYHELSQNNVTIIDTGHGRAGLFTTVLSYILMGKRYIRVVDNDTLSQDPAEWIRNIYCHKAIESVGQEICLLETCLLFKENNNIAYELDIIRQQLHYIFYPAKYEDIKHDWEAEIEEVYPYLCPVCHKEYDTMIEALMCHNTLTLRHCPVCQKKHNLPVWAYQCHSIVPLP